MVTIRKIEDRWVASVRQPATTGEGKGPLGAVRDLFQRLRDRGFVVETQPPEPAGPAQK